MSSAAPADPARVRLRAAGLRVTRARTAILSHLLKRGGPARVSEIRRELGSSRCDRVTVYRALAALSEAGLVRRAYCPGGAGGFEAAEGGSGRYRVLCRLSGKAEALDPESTEEIARALRATEERLRARGYRDLHHRLEFSGVAPPPPSA